jgi:hypothetical protein
VLCHIHLHAHHSFDNKKYLLILIDIFPAYISVSLALATCEVVLIQQRGFCQFPASKRLPSAE